MKDALDETFMLTDRYEAHSRISQVLKEHPY